jgi:hypothetical protein
VPETRLASLWEFRAQPVGPGSNGKEWTEMSKKGGNKPKAEPKPPMVNKGPKKP